jgi:transcriptional regulator GlxA family with amidase domain
VERQWELESRERSSPRIALPDFIEHAAYASRSSARAECREAGITPTAFVERLRLEAARRALELTTRSTKQIADTCGFGTVETMHRAFRRSLGTTPVQYRERFQ